ncbi:RNA-protein complex protein Nop10 [Halovivax gelatinilyticus]|uniref:RNA-protein complex protein Nop10 n=1 Tax=Halovivax gelatinilyticus TaxID=2961597 RepID=UPI0020CA6BE6|nr:RNA-protein complex protein Nop10 [Halovivax gelatinilyticus]
MKSDIKRCVDWSRSHERPVYTLEDRCPLCDADTENTSPAPISPEDSHGEYRRALKRRLR